MGSLFKGPKMPKPVVVPPPAIDDTENQKALVEDRKRRAGATGSTGNIVSSLVGSVGDAGAGSAKSTLLGG